MQQSAKTAAVGETTLVAARLEDVRGQAKDASDEEEADVDDTAKTTILPLPSMRGAAARPRPAKIWFSCGQLVAWFAHWAVRQSPRACPKDLESAVLAFRAVVRPTFRQVADMSHLTREELVIVVREALRCVPQIEQWAAPNAELGSVDVDALRMNIVRSLWEEGERETAPPSVVFFDPTKLEKPVAVPRDAVLCVPLSKSQLAAKEHSELLNKKASGEAYVVGLFLVFAMVIVVCAVLAR